MIDLPGGGKAITQEEFRQRLEAEARAEPCYWCSASEDNDVTDADLISWHVEQVEALRPFTRSSHHLKAAMMHATTVRALRAAAEAGGVR